MKADYRPLLRLRKTRVEHAGSRGAAVGRGFISVGKMLLPPTHVQITGGVYEQLSTLGLPNCPERRLRTPAGAEQTGTGQAQNRGGAEIRGQGR